MRYVFYHQSQDSKWTQHHVINCLNTLRCFRIRRFEKKIKPNPLCWISKYIKPGLKRFVVWDKWRGLNLDIFVWFLLWLCKIEVLTNLPQSVEGFLLLNYFFFGSKSLVMFEFYHFCIATTFLGRLYLFFEEKIVKLHRKSQEKNFE